MRNVYILFRTDIVSMVNYDGIWNVVVFLVFVSTRLNIPFQNNLTISIHTTKVALIYVPLIFSHFFKFIMFTSFVDARLRIWFLAVSWKLHETLSNRTSNFFCNIKLSLINFAALLPQAPVLNYKCVLLYIMESVFLVCVLPHYIKGLIINVPNWK